MDIDLLIGQDKAEIIYNGDLIIGGDLLKRRGKVGLFVLAYRGYFNLIITSDALGVFEQLTANLL